MRQINLSEPKKVSIDEVEKPTLQKNHALIKLKYNGICGSDTGAFYGKNPTAKYPIIGLGHEGVGYIEEIEENEKGLKKGDFVTIEPYISCGTCHQCVKGETGNCTQIKVCGVHTVGMMSDYFSHPVRLLHKVPGGMTEEKAVLTEPFTIGMQAATQGYTKKGDVCLIFGSGVIGLMAGFSVKHLGGTPIIVDVIQERLDMAKKMGFEHVYNSKDGELLAYVEKVTGGKLADVVIDCTGAPPILLDIHMYCAYGANIVLVGWPKEPVLINTIKCMQKELTIRTSRNSSGKFPICMELINSGFLPVDLFLTQFITVAQTEDILNKIIDKPEDYLKVVINFEN